MILPDDVRFFEAANSIKLLPEDQDFRIIFGKAIHKLRLMLGFSKEYVAEIFCFSLNLMTKFESGTESAETFYECSNKILSFFRQCVDSFLVVDTGYFEWLFEISPFFKLEIEAKREKFEKFLNHNFYAEPLALS